MKIFFSCRLLALVIGLAVQLFANPAREAELSEFYKKLESALQRQKQIEHGLNTNSVFKKIKGHMGNGNYFVVFNCTFPSYMNYNKQIVYLSSAQPALQSELKRSDKCDMKHGLWYFGTDPGFTTTIDLKTQKLSTSLLPFKTLYTIFHKLSLCRDFLKLMGHPAYYWYSFRPPDECPGSQPQPTGSSSSSKSSSSSSRGKPTPAPRPSQQQQRQQYPTSAPARRQQYPVGTTGGYKPPPGFSPVDGTLPPRPC